MGPELIILPQAILQGLAALVLLNRLKAAPSPRNADVCEAADVSIIIPARDEEKNLEALLASLDQQDQVPGEVIVVDDGSEDRTAEVALKGGARVVPATGPPDGWRGKTWACMTGGSVATGRLLLFLDADCRLEPGGLKALLERYAGGALSCCPWHRVQQPYEQLSALFNILMAAGTIPRRLCGPCLLVERETYLAIGGHSAVKGRILENVALSRIFRTRGYRVASIPGKGIVSFRMYPEGIRALVAGWTKGIQEGAGSVGTLDLLLICFWIGGLVTGVAAPFLASWGCWVYAACAFQFWLVLRRVGSFSILLGPGYPLALAFYLAVFLRSLGPAGRAVEWKGRRIHED